MGAFVGVGNYQHLNDLDTLETLLWNLPQNPRSGYLGVLLSQATWTLFSRRYLPFTTGGPDV